MSENLQYQFLATVWQYSATGGWYFVSLPAEISKEIRENLKWQEEGWGRLKTTAEIRNNSWKTALWFDTKQNTYLLAIKAAIRKKENIEAGSELFISIRL